MADSRCNAVHLHRLQGVVALPKPEASRVAEIYGGRPEQVRSIHLRPAVPGNPLSLLITGDLLWRDRLHYASVRSGDTTYHAVARRVVTGENHLLRF